MGPYVDGPPTSPVLSGPAKVGGEVVRVGQEVYTTYGAGKIIEIRSDDMLVVRPTTWNLANGCVPTFYIKATPPAHTPGVSLVPPPSIPYVDGPPTSPVLSGPAKVGGEVVRVGQEVY